MKTHQLSAVALAISVGLSVPSYAEVVAEDFDGENMVVTGSRIEQSLEDVAGSVSVVTDEQIERLMVTDLDSMFRYDPSISTTGSGAQPQTVTVRGIGGNRLVYIKDGRRVNDGYAGGGGFIVGRGYFDTDSVRQVEVAKGAASSLYGSDGLGGIVVITTKDPEDYLAQEDSFLSLGVGYEGSSEQTKVGFSAAKKLGNWGTSLNYTHRNGHEVQNFAGDLPGYDSDSGSVVLKAQSQLNQNHSLKFTLDLYQQDIEQIIAVGANETRDGDDNVSFSIDHEWDKKTTLFDSISSQIYITQYEQESVQVRASSRGYTDFNNYRFEQDILGIRAVLNKAIDLTGAIHNIVYGFDYDAYETTRPRIKTRILADGTTDFTDAPQRAFPGADTTLAGLFLQDNIEFKDSGLTLILGGRLDLYDMEPKTDPLYADAHLAPIDENAFSPKVALTYSVTEDTNVYAQFVQGFKIPPHDQAYQNHGVEPFYQILPNSALEPEESDTVETGVKVFTDDISFQFNVFYSEFDNFIETALVGMEDTFIPGVTKSIFQYQNLKSTTIKGMEASAEFTLADDWFITANIAYADGENDETNQPLTSISPLQGSMLLQRDFDNWQVTGAFRFAKSMTDVPVDNAGTELITSAGYGVFDLFAQAELGDFKLSLGVDNLFDKEYVMYESIAGMAADTNTSQYTQIGREFSASLSYTF